MTTLAESLRKIALLAVAEPDEEAHLRRIRRWYSKTFHTPLHKVEELSLDHILLNYFEENFSELNEDDLYRQIRNAIESPQERLEREQREHNADAEYERKLLEKLKKDTKEKPKLDLLDLEMLKNKPLKAEPIKQIPEEEVKIEFVDDTSFEEGLEEDTLGKPQS